jgi:hypothetical protein
MNRLFGRGKEKVPPPNINDCITSVSELKHKAVCDNK